jgi:hypothetical protein
MSNTKYIFIMSPSNRCNNIDPNIDFGRNGGGALPNKYAKLMHFGVWLITNANVSNDIRNDFFDKLNVFANVEVQSDFFENFYSGEKEIAKTMRKFSAEKIKELRKAANEVHKETGPKGRDQILRDAFIDSIIAKFGVGGRTNNIMIPIL